MLKFPTVVVSVGEEKAPGVPVLSECGRVARRSVAESSDKEYGSATQAPAESFWQESGGVRFREQKKELEECPFLCPNRGTSVMGEISGPYLRAWLGRDWL